MESKKTTPSLNELCDLIVSLFEHGNDFYINSDILEFFNNETESNTTMTPLGKSLSSLGYKRGIKKINGKTERGFYLKIIL